MRDMTIERSEDAARDLIDALRAYDRQLDGLDPDWPGVRALRRAIGVALAEARQYVPDWGGGDKIDRVRH